MGKSGIVVLVLALAARASAEPNDYRFETGQPVPIVHKNPTKAVTLSVIGTLSGIGLLYFGSKMGEGEGDVMKGFAGAFMIMGPSWGEWWVQDRVVLTPGMALRAAGFGVGGLAVGTDRQCNAIARMTGGGTDCVSSTRQTASDSMLGVGFALVAAGTLYDVIDAARQARHRRFVVTPALTSTSAGLVVTSGF